MMQPLIPARFLVRIAHPCPYVGDCPRTKSKNADDLWLDLPASGRLRSYTERDDRADHPDIRMAWNERGIAVQVTVSGKSQRPSGDADRPFAADGLTLWLDTRDARTSHRASRYCHQFHLLPVGGGPDRDQPCFMQSKIQRALQDAALCQASEVLFHGIVGRTGYTLELFLPAAVLTGFDPEQHPRLGVYYHLRDAELGDDFLGVSADFPIADDPTMWDTLELHR